MRNREGPAMKTRRGYARPAVSIIALLAAGGAGVWAYRSGSTHRAVAHASQAVAPQPTPLDTSHVLKVGGTKTYQDGSYTGPAVYQYYGYVQTRVDIRNGRISSVKILQYPSDYSTSVYINTRALPVLQSEVIQAQNTKISGISGATLTSLAFVMSTHAALQKASG